MKKNNSYYGDDEIDLRDLIKAFCREKFLILSVSIICGLLSYFYITFQPQNFKTIIKIKDPPFQLFLPYNNSILNNNNNNNDDNNNNNNDNDLNKNKANNSIVNQFIFNFKSNFLSLDNLEIFLDKSTEFDSFKRYLKSKKITAKQYFMHNKFGIVMIKNRILPNQYFLVSTQDLDGDIFLNNYAEFIKNITVQEFKENLKLTIENQITLYEQALQSAKNINLENPLLKTLGQNSPVLNDPASLHYRGSKILSDDILYLNKLLSKLEKDQFNYNVILDKAPRPWLNTGNPIIFLFIGFLSGLFLSLFIVYAKILFNK